MPLDEASVRRDALDEHRIPKDAAGVSRADAPTREKPGRNEPAREIPDTERHEREREDREKAESPVRRDHEDVAGGEKDIDDDGGKGGDRGDKDGTKQKRTSPWVWVILAIIVAGLIAAGVVWYIATKDQESTDDAFTDGNAVPIASKVSGYVVDRAVNDNQFVKSGEVIVKIDKRDYVVARDQANGNVAVAQGQLASAQASLAVAKKNFPARLASANAQLQSARAEQFRAEKDAARQHAVSRAATTQQQVDQADAALLTAKADVAKAEAAVQEATPVQENINQSSAQASQVEGTLAQAKAQLEQADLNLSYTTVAAPQDGWVTKRNVDKGTYLTAGSTMLQLVSPQVWVTANFKESQLDRMRPGQKVDISVDAYPGLKLEGHVDSIQLGTGSKFSAFPAENATGNFVKIVQRVPVKIVIDSGLDPKLPLPLGISVSPTVHLK